MIGVTLDNRYTILEHIGEGGMAIVYKAQDSKTDHLVAVKVLRKEFSDNEEYVARFKREVEAASKMTHHNIVNLLDVGEYENHRYLVMEHVQGQTLKEYMSLKEKVPVHIAFQITIRILSALQHAHSKGIIHRDIKPQNILIDQEGHVKIADFGIARVTGTDTLSQKDKVLGSAHYLSPEQAQGLEVTEASDIYSTAIVLYEMLTKHVPFDGESPVNIAIKHIKARHKPLEEYRDDIPLGLEYIISKALEKSPEKRYTKAVDMAKDIHELATSTANKSTFSKEQGKISPQAPQPKQSAKSMNNFKRRMLYYGVPLITAAVIFVLMITGVFSIYDQIVNTLEAPYVIGEREEIVMRTLEKLNLVADITRTSDENIEKGIVILQTPDFETKMRKGETIFLTISTGSSLQTVPKIVGDDIEQAKETCAKLGFKVLVASKHVLSDAPYNTILTQDPLEGAQLSSGGIIQVTLSGGKVILPQFVDMNKEDALLLAQTSHINIEEIREIPTSDTTKLNLVAAQQFENDQGEEYNPGDTVIEETTGTLAVYVSNQPKPKEVLPELEEEP